MYNEQIEQLISAALADGVLTEKEKQILFKKAQGMGIDLDEFEMVLDARLVELQKAEKEKAEKSAPKSNKLGDVKKCPACGAIVQSYQGKCPECGYEFEDIEANKAVKELADLLKKAKKDQFADIVRTFPIPSTKGNLIEFMSFLQSNTSDITNADVYASKLQECIIKAKTFFNTDTQLMLLVTKVEEAEKIRIAKQKKQLSAKNRKAVLHGLWKALPWIIIALLVVVEWIFLYNEEDWHPVWVILINIVTIGGLGFGVVTLKILFDN